MVAATSQLPAASVVDISDKGRKKWPVKPPILDATDEAGSAGNRKRYGLRQGNAD